jgi:hypothetical protein
MDASGGSEDFDAQNPSSDAAVEGPNALADAACDATTSSMTVTCPSLASSCPCGCYVAANPERYDRTRGCLEPWSPDVNVCSTNPVSLAVVSCWVRVDTGDAYWFNGTPLSATLLGNGWQPCTQTDGIPTDGGYGPPTCPSTAADFAGIWSCPIDDAGDALGFTVVANGDGLTETFSPPLMGTSGNLICTAQFSVSGSTATLIPSLTTCTVPKGVDLEGVPFYGSQTVSGNTLTYAEEDEGGPLQTVSCTRQ